MKWYFGDNVFGWIMWGVWIKKRWFIGFAEVEKEAQ